MITQNKHIHKYVWCDDSRRPRLSHDTNRIRKYHNMLVVYVYGCLLDNSINKNDENNNTTPNNLV